MDSVTRAIVWVLPALSVSDRPFHAPKTLTLILRARSEGEGKQRKGIAKSIDYDIFQIEFGAKGRFSLDRLARSSQIKEKAEEEGRPRREGLGLDEIGSQLLVSVAIQILIRLRIWNSQ